MPQELSLHSFRQNGEKAVQSYLSYKETQESDGTNPDNLTVMTENAEEISIMNQGVTFQHQLHELEMSQSKST